MNCSFEIGFGTGHCISEISKSVYDSGNVYGIDISEGMLEITSWRLAKAALSERAELTCDDATALTYAKRRRISVVAMSGSTNPGIMMKFYEWAHRNYEKYVNCRPVFIEQALKMPVSLPLIQPYYLRGFAC